MDWSKTKKSFSPQRRRKAAQECRDEEIAMDLKDRPHYFVVFRLELDECGKCGKPRADHPKRSKPQHLR